MQDTLEGKLGAIECDSEQRYLEEGLKRKLRMYSKKISLDLREEKELGMQLGC